jgi:hypothetical protein
VTDDRSEIEQEEEALVICFWCERLHSGKYPVSVCPACAARYSKMRSLEMNGFYPLSDEALTPGGVSGVAKLDGRKRAAPDATAPSVASN